MKGVLYLIPTPIAPESPDAVFTAFNPTLLQPIRHFVIEEIKSARRFLRKLFPDFPIDACQFTLLNEHTSKSEYADMLQPLLDGHNMGLMSEAGLPCVADPGWQIVALAHERGITVKPLAGPSSLMQGLMASGFIGQQFVFHGYLPVIPAQRVNMLKQIEKDALFRHYTQIFIETPYRNQQMLNSMVNTLRPDTWLCVASGIHTEQEFIKVLTIADWKATEVHLPKTPSVFLIYS